MEGRRWRSGAAARRPRPARPGGRLVRGSTAIAALDRITVGTLVGLVAAGHTKDDILRLYAYVEAEDIRQALEYAARRAEEVGLPLAKP